MAGGFPGARRRDWRPLITTNLKLLPDRLFQIFASPDFLAMKGIANGVPIFIQAYDPADEDAVRGIVGSIANRLRNQGLAVRVLDLFDLMLAELEQGDNLHALVDNEANAEKVEFLHELRNLSDPKTHLIPRLIEAIGEEGTQLTLITGSGRVYPFLRTHSVLESTELAQLRHPVVIFFPGEYSQDAVGGSHLRLFGRLPSPTITNP